MPLPNIIRSPRRGPFERFYRRWLVRLDELRQLLLQANERLDREQGEEDEARLIGLIRRVVSHYAAYFRAKQRIIRDDPLILFGPPWLTSYERTLLWIGGFRPGFAFRVVGNYVRNLTEEQKVRLALLMVETAGSERALTAEFSRMQNRLPAQSLVELATRRRERMNGESDSMDQQIQLLRSSTKVLLECADFVRCKTVGRIMDILNTSQNIKFLLAIAQLQHRIRNWTLQGEADQNRPDNADH